MTVMTMHLFAVLLSLSIYLSTALELIQEDCGVAQKLLISSLSPSLHFFLVFVLIQDECGLVPNNDFSSLPPSLVYLSPALELAHVDCGAGPDNRFSSFLLSTVSPIQELFQENCSIQNISISLTCTRAGPGRLRRGSRLLPVPVLAVVDLRPGLHPHHLPRLPGQPPLPPRSTAKVTNYFISQQSTN